MKKEVAIALFTLAGIEIKSIHMLANGYWPDMPDYYECRRKSPWWLVETPFGLVKIGWRKRVISISWEGTAVRCIVTEDDVTKDETMVHAWPDHSKGVYIKALEYLSALGVHVRCISKIKDPTQ